MLNIVKEIAILTERILRLLLTTTAVVTLMIISYWILLHIQKF
jgi:hypothetical protein